MDTSRITITDKNIFYTLRYDGCILQYKARVIWTPLLRLFGLARRIEFPINAILNLESRGFMFLRKVTPVTNQFSSRSKKLRPLVLRSMLFLEGNNYKTLQKLISHHMASNYQGTNVGLGYIAKDQIVAYYNKIGYHLKTA